MKKGKALNVHRQTESHLELVARGGTTTREENNMSASDITQTRDFRPNLSILPVFLAKTIHQARPKSGAIFVLSSAHNLHPTRPPDT